MKKILLFNLFTAFIFSQKEIAVDTLLIKMDTLLINQGQMLVNQEKILYEVEYIDPLEGKKIGIEFNPAGFLLASTTDEIEISGGISLFAISKTAEIAFPIYSRVGANDFSLFQIDGHYRKFTGKHRNGFYISSGVRYISITGRDGVDFFGIPLSTSDEISQISRFGLTFGIGYRIFGNNGWYWGTSLFAGRYLTESDITISGANASDSDKIIDMELLKIGRLF